MLQLRVHWHIIRRAIIIILTRELNEIWNALARCSEKVWRELIWNGTRRARGAHKERINEIDLRGNFNYENSTSEVYETRPVSMANGKFAVSSSSSCINLINLLQIQRVFRSFVSLLSLFIAFIQFFFGFFGDKNLFDFLSRLKNRKQLIFSAFSAILSKNLSIFFPFLCFSDKRKNGKRQNKVKRQRRWDLGAFFASSSLSFTNSSSFAGFCWLFIAI